MSETYVVNASSDMGIGFLEDAEVVEFNEVGPDRVGLWVDEDEEGFYEGATRRIDVGTLLRIADLTDKYLYAVANRPWGGAHDWEPLVKAMEEAGFDVSQYDDEVDEPE